MRDYVKQYNNFDPTKQDPPSIAKVEESEDTSFITGESIDDNEE